MTARVAAQALAIAVAYGATDEVHQMFVPGRTPDVMDVLADAAGALVAAAVCLAWGILSRPASFVPRPKSG